MIPYELFEKTINSIQAKEDSDHEVTKLLDTMCDGYPIFGVDNGFTGAMLNLLKVGMQDMGDTISWWLYEDVEKVIWWQEDGKEIECHLDTTRNLYDYLVRESPDLSDENYRATVAPVFCNALEGAKKQRQKDIAFSKGLSELCESAQRYCTDVLFQCDINIGLVYAVSELAAYVVCGYESPVYADIIRQYITNDPTTDVSAMNVEEVYRRIVEK